MTHTTELPAGFRSLTAEEGDHLDSASRVLVFDRGLNRIVPYRVVAYNPQRGWHLGIFDGGEEVDTVYLDDDEPAFWSEAREMLGERHGPRTLSGSHVAFTLIDPDDLCPLLEQSLYPIEARELADECRHLTLIVNER